MEVPFRLDVRLEDGAAVLVLRGELDLISAPELAAELARAWQAEVRVVIVDLRAVSFMDSSGLRVLVSANQYAQVNDLQFAVVEGSDQVRKLFELTQIAETLTVVAAPEELLR